MNKSYILGSFFIGVVLGVSITFLIMNKNDKEVDSNITENEKNNQLVDKSEEFVSTVDVNGFWEDVYTSKMIDEWNSGDKLFHENLIQDIIQEMAHQKIIAYEKDHSIMITPKRIDKVLQMVEENKDEYKHSDKYLDILKRWKQGDFTTVDDDHNIVMRIQRTEKDGTATGIATEEQELDYILRVFGKVADKVFDSSTIKEFEIEDEKDESIAIEDIDLSWVDDVHAEMLDEWKSGDLTFDERLVQKVMRDMTHQKINTHVEEGSIVITSERIDNLIQIVEVQGDNGIFHHRETYLDILKRWKKSDFSTVENDHNVLHDL